MTYNAAALRVMKKAGVAVNDLHALASSKLSEIQLPKNVHFTPEGSRLLAKQVADSIRNALAISSKQRSRNGARSDTPPGK